MVAERSPRIVKIALTIPLPAIAPSQNDRFIVLPIFSAPIALAALSPSNEGLATDRLASLLPLPSPPQPAAVIAAARRASIDLNHSLNASSSSFRPVPSSSIFVAILIVVVAPVGGGDGISQGGGGFLDVLDGVIDVAEEAVGRVGNGDDGGGSRRTAAGRW